MARTKEIIRTYRGTAVCEERVVEFFTHKVVLPDGTVLRGDPANQFWGTRGGSWYGEPPRAWDDARAVAEEYRDSYCCEIDYG